MRQKLDRVMYEISVVYIALPVFIFLAGWLRIIVAIPVCVIFLISVYLMLKNKPEPVAWHLTKAQGGILIASVILLAVWVFLSGQGGFAFQNSDYQYRNAIFHDLIDKSWPVIYSFPSQNAAVSASIASTPSIDILTYYIAFWLPGSLVGKIFGWYAANVFLYLWALLGVVLIAYYLFRTVRKTSIWTVLILIFFSGMDILGYISVFSKLPGPIDHIEWWSGLQYSSNTTQLFWVFNQTIAVWLAILLIMNMKNSRSLFFLYAMLLLHAPFPFLGMLPIVLWKAYQGYPLSLRSNNTVQTNLIRTIFVWLWSGVRRAITFENVCGGISVLLIVYLYLSNNISAAKTGTNSVTMNYFVFIIFEFGIFMIFLFADHYKNPLFWICLISLIVIPFFRIGTSQDFCMRVSIPALFMVQIMVQQTLIGKAALRGTAKNPAAADNPAITDKPAVTADALPRANKYALTEHDMKLIRVMLAVVLLIGTVVPIQEISRSVVYTLPPYNVTWADTVKTLANSEIQSSNFLGSVKDNLFYEYLARKS